MTQSNKGEFVNLDFELFWYLISSGVGGLCLHFGRQKQNTVVIVKRMSVDTVTSVGVKTINCDTVFWFSECGGKERLHILEFDEFDWLVSSSSQKLDQKPGSKHKS